MRADGSLEIWDEKFLQGYREAAVRADPRTGKPYRQRRARGARIQDLFVMIKEALDAYQGYFAKSAPFRGSFQFARYLEKGDEITNRTTGDLYTVSEILKEPDGTFLGEVILTGNTDPLETDRLRLDPRNCVVFSHADPRSEVPSSEFKDTGDKTDEPAPFSDVIEYSRRRYEPGTVGKRPFDRERQALPRLREPNVDDIHDPRMGEDIKGWWFDNIIQFDLYGRTNKRLDGSPKLDGSGDPGLLTWFQDFMQRYRWVFLWNGTNNILEWQGNEDKPVGRIRNDMVHRPLLYYVRTERISSARFRRIEQLDLLVNIGAPPELSAQSGYPVPTGQISVTINDLGLYATLGGS